MRDRLFEYLGVAWLAAVGVGFGWWHGIVSAPIDNPAAADTRGPSGRWTLTLFLHPHCPCGLARLDELEGMAAEAAVPVSIEIVVVRPASVPSGWEHGIAWERANHLPGVVVRVGETDDARQSGAVGSGHAVLTDPSGIVVFRGGLSRAAIVAHLRRDFDAPVSAPVYGCRLLDSTTPGG